MSGGLWGARRGALPNLLTMINNYPANSDYLTDMLFLNKEVWPLAQRGHLLQHDSFSCDAFEGAEAYPAARDETGAHVGQVKNKPCKRATSLPCLPRCRTPMIPTYHHRILSLNLEVSMVCIIPINPPPLP